MPIAHNAAPVPYVSQVPFSQWGALAYDIALDNGSTGVEDILSCYGITQLQLEELQENPRFQAVYEDVQKELARFGENASFRARVRALTENMLPTMYARAVDPLTEPKDVIAIFKSFASLSGLDPATNGTKNATDTPVLGNGGAFTLVLNGIPGLEHLQNKIVPDSSSAQVVYTEPAKPSIINAPTDNETL